MANSCVDSLPMTMAPAPRSFCTQTASAVAMLSCRTLEWQVVGLAAHGHSYKLIAYELGLTVSTVSTHLARATAKLGIDSRRSLLALLSQAPPHLAGDKDLGPHAPHEGSV